MIDVFQYCRVDCCRIPEIPHRPLARSATEKFLVQLFQKSGRQRQKTYKKKGDMKLSECLPVQRIFLGVKLPDKDSVLRFVADESCRAGVADDAEALYQALIKREESMSTGLGRGIAFPHASTKIRGGISVFLISLDEPVLFDAVDNRPVDIIVAIVMPENDTSKHLQILARTSRLCQKTEFAEIVRNMDDPGKLWHQLDRLEKRLFEYWYEV